MSDTSVKLDELPQLVIGVRDDQSGAGFHAGIVGTSIRNSHNANLATASLESAVKAPGPGRTLPPPWATPTRHPDLPGCGSSAESRCGYPRSQLTVTTIIAPSAVPHVSHAAALRPRSPCSSRTRHITAIEGAMRNAKAKSKLAGRIRPYTSEMEFATANPAAARPVSDPRSTPSP